MTAQSHSVADVESFITMLRAACEAPAMKHTLNLLLEQPDERRQNLVRWLVNDLEQQRAPTELLQAIACLVDDDIAKQARVVLARGRN